MKHVENTRYVWYNVFVNFYTRGTFEEGALQGLSTFLNKTTL